MYDPGILLVPPYAIVLCAPERCALTNYCSVRYAFCPSTRLAAILISRFTIENALAGRNDHLVFLIYIH